MTSQATIRRHHQGWLDLLQRTGPFLTLPILMRTWPAGLEPVPKDTLDDFRVHFAEWSEDPAARQREWITSVLIGVLGWGDRLVQGPDVPRGLELAVPEHRETLLPDFGFLGSAGEQPRLLGAVYAPGTPLTARLAGHRWPTSPVDRLAMLLRHNDVPLGLATDGRWWALVWAPKSAFTAVASWDGAVWLEERDTLAAFRSLLERRRFIGVPDQETLSALLEACLDAQEEITEGLGRQVRRAVEMIVEAIGRAARAGGPSEALLQKVNPDEVYRAAVTVMMRLIFLLFAEERQLLPADDELYLSCYSASHLVDSLRATANELGEDALEHRTSAWHRLLSLFRGIHRGIAHDRLRIPAYGGGVFDPDKFSWLEGRPGSDASLADERVLPIDDRTVLHALEALQFVQLKGERRRLTFRTLDVEQIGYVYEGLLGYDAHRATSPVVGLIGQEGEESEVELAELEVRGANASWLQERTGLSTRRIDGALAPGAESAEREKERLLRTACGGDESLVDRLRPFAGLLRADLRGIPVVVPAGGIYVTESPLRRLSGTHYTPRDLAAQVVEGALEPLVFSPGPLDAADRSSWKLRPSRELLALRVVDIAMGSGAFLVAACRYLADRLVEAWAQEGNPFAAQRVAETEALVSDSDADPVRVDARRRVIEHCLYGGDINDMAVEMAKLSLWLVSLSRERPFSFLDDRLVCGDSLLGLTSLDQLRNLHLDPKRAARSGEKGLDLWGVVHATLERVEAIRRELAEHELRDIRDALYKARLLARAEESVAPLRVIADALVGAGLAAAGEKRDADAEILKIAFDAAAALRSDPERQRALLAEMASTAEFRLDTGRPADAFDRRPTHWPLAFPEVFEAGGFDAVVGNPPFLGGKKISGALGDAYREFLVRRIANSVRGNADIVAYFVLTAHRILNSGGQTGLIATNTLAQGDTREVALDQLAGAGVSIRAAVKSAKWPTRAVNLEYSVLWSSRRAPTDAAGCLFEGRWVKGITTSLDPVGRAEGKPFRLGANSRIAFIGSYVLGMGFTMRPEEAKDLVNRDPHNREVLFPYLGAEDLNSRPDSVATRWVIDFRDRSESEAREWPDCWSWVERNVKPERAEKDRSKYPKMVEQWWMHWNMRHELYAAISVLDRVIAIALHSRTVLPILVPKRQVFSHGVAVLAYDDPGHLGMLSSAFHYWWAITHGSTIRTDLRYTPSDIFETFAQPPLTERLQKAGEALEVFRRPLMLERQLGITATYDLVHNPRNDEKAIERLREIHVEIDIATADAYGWADLALDHGFHPTRQGVRFTVSEAARTELLDRILELNHERHANDAAGGITSSRRKRKGQAAAGEIEQRLLDAIFRGEK